MTALTIAYDVNHLINVLHNIPLKFITINLKRFYLIPNIQTDDL